MRSTYLSRAFLFLAAGALLTGPALASEWPSWRGPARNGVSPETGLVSSWSTTGENLIWRQDFTGRSTPVVVNGRVCANGRAGTGIDRQEMVACFDAESGKKLWEHRFNVYHTTVPWNRVGWANPGADPETGYLYVQGVGGTFLCLDSADGRVVWEKVMIEELGFMEGYGGRTQTPVIDEDRVIVTFASTSWGDQGIPRHRMYAFDKLTGDVIWGSSPAKTMADKNTQSTPAVAVINGQRLLIQGNGGGWIFAVKSRTGEKVWEFQLSKRGINTSVLVDGTTVYAAHSEENIDKPDMGRVVAIDATGTGNVTKTHELWRAHFGVGYSSPVLDGGRLYVVDNKADLHALDAKTGKELWEYSIGTVGKGSPMVADGKIYVTEVNGHLLILEPSDSGAKALDKDELKMADGRYAEVYGSVAIAYGRVFFTTEEGIYAIGDKSAAFDGAAGERFTLEEEAPAKDAAVAKILVVPGDIQMVLGETRKLEVQAFDAKGRALGVRKAEWSVEGLGSSVDGGKVTASGAAGVGYVVARVGGVEAKGRLRVSGGLPLDESFESYEVGKRPPYLLGSVSKFKVAEFDGAKVLAKPPSKRMLHRHYTFVGSPNVHDYTIQADLHTTQTGRRVADIGLVNGGYKLDLLGARQKLEVRSWASALRMAERVDFNWKPDVWYTMKFRVANAGGKAIIDGKAWPRDEPEPNAWTISVVDPHPIKKGSPGIIGYSPATIYFDNLKVYENGTEIASTPQPAKVASTRSATPPTKPATKPATSSATNSTRPSASVNAGGNQETAMFGGSPGRNMVSSETGLVTEWDIDTGENILWSQKLGSQAYGGPLVYDGQVYMGTNNEAPRNPAIKGDKGVVMTFSLDGEFLWQSVHDKLTAGRVNDWPLQGVCSTPAIRGDRMYYITNRAEIICADTRGFRDGENDGPFKDEKLTGEANEDIIWKYDMIGELDVFPHNLAVGNPIIVGDLLFTVTGNGVDEGHINIPSPLAPSFIAIDIRTGELVWEDASPGNNILHGEWSNPAYGLVNGEPQVVFPGGDGWLYSFEPETGKLIWKFDCNPKDSVWELGGAGSRNSLISTPVFHDGRVYIGVGQDPEHGEGHGHLWALDASKKGDITETGVIWHRGGEEFNRTISTVAIADGLIYASELTGRVYCLDLATGEHHWTYDAFAAIWGSPYVVDGKVYIGDEDGDVAILKAGTKLELIGEINMGSAMYTTPVAHDGVLYIGTRNVLYAVGKKGASKKASR